MLTTLELLSYTCANRVETLLCYPGEMQGLLSQMLQPVGGRDSSPAPVTLGPILPLASGVDGCGKGEQLSPVHAATRQKPNGGMLTTLGPACPDPR